MFGEHDELQGRLFWSGEGPTEYLPRFAMSTEPTLGNDTMTAVGFFMPTAQEPGRQRQRITQV